MRFVPISELTEDQQPYGEPLPVATLIVGGRLWGDTAGKAKSNGDSSITSLLASALGTMVSDKDMPSDDPATLLVRALLKHREDALEWNGSHSDHTYYTRVSRLEVDYHPGVELSGISEAAGLRPSIWPWKSELIMHDGEIRVKIGYRRPGTCYYPLDDGRILSAAYAISAKLLPWVVERLDEGAKLAEGMAFLDWNWREYGQSIGGLPTEG